MRDLDVNEEVPKKRRRITRHVENLLNIILDHNQEKERESDSGYNSNQDKDNDLEIAGKIKSIKLQNFMCHSNFEFSFEDKVNFISGKNGSGKSALLTALVIGLGGRTADTNRGQSLKNLIQNGKHKAVIEIVLNNRGFSSFKPNIYGKKIKIVRAITSSSSSYKIISERGDIISTKREDIDLINLYFNIQVNNPVTVLNQDTARTFIKTAAPKDLYAIFVKGTHLEEIEQRHLSLKNEKLPFLEKIIASKNNELIENFKDVNEYKEKLKKMDELHKLEKKAKILQDELYWSYVSKLDKKIKAQKEIEMECLKRIPQIQDRVEKRDKIENELNEKQRSSESELNEFKEKKRVVENNIIQSERSLANIKEQIGKKVSEIKHVNKKIAAENKSCNDIMTEIDNHQSRCEEVEVKKRKLELQKGELEKRLSDLKAITSTTVVHNQQLNDTLEKSDRTVKQKEQYYHNLEQKLSYKEQYLEGLKVEKNQFIVYSQWMPELVARIEQAYKTNKFKHKPLGPIGAFIKLEEKSWGPAIESIIGQRVLSSFCVDNVNDYKVFKSIVDRLQIPTNQKPLITTSKFFNKVHDVSPNETKFDRYKNLLKSISISEPVIANSLIDQLEPETTLLIPSSEEAYPLMENKDRVPKNCRRVITKKGDIFFPAPNYRSYFGSVSETRYLQVSPAQAIKIAKSEIANLQNEISKAAKEVEDAKNNYSLSKKQLEQSNLEVSKLKRQSANCENKLDELRKEDIPESFDVNLLKEDLVYRQNVIKTCQENMEALEAEKNKLLLDYQEDKNKIDQLQKEKEEHSKEIERLKVEIEGIKSEYYKITANRDHYKNLLKSEESKLESIRKVLKDLEKDFNKAESEAKEAQPEQILEPRDVTYLEDKLTNLNSIIKTMEKLIGNIENIPAFYEERLKVFSYGIAELRQIEEVKQKLFMSVSRLKDTYVRIKEIVSANTKHSFLRMLQKKNYKGDLVIEHNKKTLSVIIKVDAAAKDGSSTVTLSGGERSYSMVSFIMSLWSNMYSPFFFLDEFDVFMDEINRNMVLSLLVAYARSKPDQQFVFLTPHGNLAHDLLKDVHFFRMGDPRRNTSED